MIICFLGAANKKPSAGKLGIVIGIISIISLDIINIVLGIFVLINSIKYNKIVKK